MLECHVTITFAVIAVVRDIIAIEFFCHLCFPNAIKFKHNINIFNSDALYSFL